jgi:hypothetical protein
LNGTTYSISYEGCSLSSEALNDIYEGLGTTYNNSTITITGNPGVNSDNPSIATSKGWTVIG